MSQHEDQSLTPHIDQFKANIKERVNNEVPKLDINYQKGVLKLCWMDEKVLARVYFSFKRLKISTAMKNSTTNDIEFFMSTELSHIWAAMYHFCSNDIFRIDEGALKQWINDQYSATEAENAKKVFDQIKRLEIPEPQVYKDHLQKYLEMMTVLNVFVISSELFGKKDYRAVHRMWNIGVEEFNSIALGQKSYKTIASVFDYFEDESVQTFPLGIPEIDEELSGGVARGTFNLVLAGSNVGKTAFSVERARVWASMGFKVAYYALDSAPNEISRRAAANAARVPLKGITRKTLTAEQMARVKKAAETITEDNLRIIEDFSYPDPVEEIVLDMNRLCKEWKPDIIIVDYLDKLGSTKFFSKKNELLGHVANVLKSCAAKNNICMVSPSQATREAQKIHNGTSKTTKAPEDFVMNLTDVGNSQEIPNVVAAIISINATEEELKKGLRRIALVKTREGESRVVVGVKTCLAESVFITGEFYNPMAVAMDLDVRPNPQQGNQERKNAPTSEAQAKEKLIELDSKIVSLRSDIKKSEEIIKSIDDRHSEQYRAERMLLDNLKQEIGPILRDARELARVLYPQVTEALIEEMTKSNKDLKKGAKTKPEIDNYNATMLETRLMAYAVRFGRAAEAQPFNPPNVVVETSKDVQQQASAEVHSKDETATDPKSTKEEGDSAPGKGDSVNPDIDF
ncbi:DnaB-like helicase C-terminal domain-containing protein [Bdellovibrio sp. BCCA]|uniref:DnaB-like helicase C-terminal domain-containing protein n=1 Tax=Bdellovibrio sp. BCCA TaxID=3136281 RepID=UPI0030F24996